MVDPKPGAAPIHLDRAELYRGHIERTVRQFGIEACGSFLVGVHDRSHGRYDLPVFEFQKQRGASTMLLPDIDLLTSNFFQGDAFRDPVAAEDKRIEAMFVGATTGGIITAEIVRTLQHPRLRAAVFFKAQAKVTFDLPVIVQCDSPETEALVAALGVSGRRRAWDEQFPCKYLLSIDGNGANCSRVAIALRSRSVLVKYNSAWQLFYFHGLEAWHHYLPVRRDDDVLTILAQAPQTEARDAAIVARAQRFAHDHLSDQACGRYSADLLRRYFAQFGAA